MNRNIRYASTTAPIHTILIMIFFFFYHNDLKCTPKSKCLPTQDEGKRDNLKEKNTTVLTFFTKFKTTFSTNACIMPNRLDNYMVHSYSSRNLYMYETYIEQKKEEKTKQKKCNDVGCLTLLVPCINVELYILTIFNYIYYIDGRT